MIITNIFGKSRRSTLKNVLLFIAPSDFIINNEKKFQLEPKTQSKNKQNGVNCLKNAICLWEYNSSRLYDILLFLMYSCLCVIFFFFLVNCLVCTRSQHHKGKRTIAFINNVRQSVYFYFTGLYYKLCYHSESLQRLKFMVDSLRKACKISL